MAWYRRSTRLRSWSYSLPGDYFVTIRVSGPGPVLCDISEGHMCLRPAGDIVEAVWRGLPDRFDGIRSDAFQVMPDHIHGVISIGLGWRMGPVDTSLDPLAGPPRLGRIVRAFKAITARRIRQEVCSGFSWQRGYHDRIVRDDSELERIRLYIALNPKRWNR